MLDAIIDYLKIRNGYKLYVMPRSGVCLDWIDLPRA